MTKFFLNSIISLGIFQVLAFTFFFFMDNGLRVFETATFKQMDDLFKPGNNQDILFLGSSRTHYGINPKPLEKLTGLKILNGGLEGAKIDEMEMVLNGYLQTHQNLKEVFLMLDPHSFDLDNIDIFNKNYLTKYLKNDSLFFTIKKRVGIKAVAWKYLPYTIVTEYDDYTRSNCFKGFLNQQKYQAHQYYKGYVALKGSFNKKGELKNGSIPNLYLGLSYVKRMIKKCQDNKIKVHIIQGPYLDSYFQQQKISNFYSLIYKELIVTGAEIQVEPLNYKNELMFKDETHLNSTGAEKYTLDLYNKFFKPND